MVALFLMKLFVDKYWNQSATIVCLRTSFLSKPIQVCIKKVQASIGFIEFMNSTVNFERFCFLRLKRLKYIFDPVFRVFTPTSMVLSATLINLLFRAGMTIQGSKIELSWRSKTIRKSCLLSTMLTIMMANFLSGSFLNCLRLACSPIFSLI